MYEQYKQVIRPPGLDHGFSGSYVTIYMAKESITHDISNTMTLCKLRDKTFINTTIVFNAH